MALSSNEVPQKSIILFLSEKKTVKWMSKIRVKYSSIERFSSVYCAFQTITYFLFTSTSLIYPWVNLGEFQCSVGCCPNYGFIVELWGTFLSFIIFHISLPSFFSSSALWHSDKGKHSSAMDVKSASASVVSVIIVFDTSAFWWHVVVHPLMVGGHWTLSTPLSLSSLFHTSCICFDWLIWLI